MARNNKFRKKSILNKIKDFLQIIINIFALSVLTYYASNNNFIAALELYLFEFPIQIIKDILLIINTFTNGT